VDGSGNVWVLSDKLPTSTSVTQREQLVEFVGAAVPVVTPTSVALTNNALATKP